VISVAVIDYSMATSSKYTQRTNSDYIFEIFKSSGPGGQNRNKVSSGVKCIHIPTGIKQERTSKCQHANRKTSREAVDNILDEMILAERMMDINTQRTDTMGTGGRGSKVRLYKFQQGFVHNVASGKKIQIKQFFKGRVDELWD